MLKRGPKSIADLAAPAIAVRAPQLRPPAHLADDEAEVFRELVRTIEPSHLAPSDAPIFATYCQAIALGRRAAAALSGGDLDAELSVLERASRLQAALSTFEKASRLQVALSARLRLCPQARAPDPRTLDRQARRASTSAYDQMRQDD